MGHFIAPPGVCGSRYSLALAEKYFSNLLSRQDSCS